MERCPDTSGYYSGKVHPCWTVVFTWKFFSVEFKSITWTQNVNAGGCWAKSMMQPLKSSDQSESWRNPMIQELKVVVVGGSERLLLAVWVPHPSRPFHYSHHPPSSLCAQPLKKKKKKNFPQPPSPCMLKPGSTLSPLLISAFRWWLDHHFLWQHQLAILQAVHTSRFLQTPRASWPLDLRHAWYLVPASHPGWPQWLEE